MSSFDSFIVKMKDFWNYMNDDYGLSWLPSWIVVDSFLSICSLYHGIIIIAIIGMFHPGVVTMYVHSDRYEKIMAKLGSILSFSYCVVCFVLLIGVLIDSEWILIFYEYFMALFVATCILVMIFTGLKLCVQRKCRITMVTCVMMPLLVFTYLAYGVIVVNSYRHTIFNYST